MIALGSLHFDLWLVEKFRNSLKQWDVKLEPVLTHSFPALEVRSPVSEFALSSQWIMVIFPLFWLASVTTFNWFIVMTLYWITLVFSQLEDEKSVLEDSNDQHFARSSCFALARTCSAREDKSLCTITHLCFWCNFCFQTWQSSWTLAH